MSANSKYGEPASFEVRSIASARSTRATVPEAQITITPPKSSEATKSAKSSRTKKQTPKKKKLTVTFQEKEEPESLNRLEAFFEKVWIWAFAFALVVSLLLSAAALSGESSSWFVTNREEDKSRVGWRLACVEHQDPHHLPDPSSTPHPNALIACGPGDSTSTLEEALTGTNAYLGYSIFGVIVGAWLLPILIVICSNYIRRTQETCCHGFSVSGVWLVTGIALFALTVTFKYTVNNHLESQFEMRYSVTCSNFDREISLCSNVRSLNTCASKCRINNQGRSVCAGYKSCELDKRKTSCHQDGIGCALDPSWAFYSAIGCAISFLFMALILAFGSLTVSKDL
eukprot:g4204.t1